MTPETTHVTLGVTAGSGLAVRRPTAVLLDVAGSNRELVDAFSAAIDDQAAIKATKDVLVDAEFAAGPFVIVSWLHELQLTVFGDVEVRTTTRQAPMLTGAGSMSWIEHSVSLTEAITITAGAAEGAQGNLELGSVPAGGLVIGLVPAGMAGSAPAAVSARVAGIDTDDQSAARAAAPVSEPLGSAGSVPPGPAGEPPTWDHTTAADAAGTERPLDPFGASTNRLVDSAVCRAGHPNPPRATACVTCGLAIDGAVAEQVIAQPSIGRLVFADRDDVTVDRRVVLGRRPEAGEADDVVVTLDHPEVSRSHAEIRVEDWQALLVDLGSRNGTWVCPPNDTNPIRLDPGVGYLLEPGAIVMLGGAELSFTFAADGVAHVGDSAPVQA